MIRQGVVAAEFGAPEPSRRTGRGKEERAERDGGRQSDADRGGPDPSERPESDHREHAGQDSNRECIGEAAGETEGEIDRE